MESKLLPQVSAPSNNNVDLEDINDRPAKRTKMDELTGNNGTKHDVAKDENKPRDSRDTKKGQAAVKAE